MPIGAAPLPWPRPMSSSRGVPSNDGLSATPKPDLTKYCIICMVLSIRSVDFCETPWALAATPAMELCALSKHWSISTLVMERELWSILELSQIRFLTREASSHVVRDLANCSAGTRPCFRQCCSSRCAKISLLSQLKSASSRQIARSLSIRRTPKTFSRSTVIDCLHLSGATPISRIVFRLVA